ncbi:MAG: hypothetical protein LBK63_12750 [Treponema sp.]|jgi:hypothetical protein|nr:hypothetical protein [Treponema sp.]
MSHKTAAVRIAAALGIPLFPLGAYFFLLKNEPANFRGTIPDIREIPEIPAVAPEKETPPPASPEILALAFRRPDRGAAGEKTLRMDAAAQAAPVPGDGKFSYLGLIRESDSREWLCIKEEETGKVIFVDPDPETANEERWVFEIEGVSYSIRRN